MASRSPLLLISMVAALGLPACTLMSDLAGCTIGAADERGGTVSRVTLFTEVGALQLADRYCRQYGRIAQETGLEMAETNMDFACVVPR